MTDLDSIEGEDCHGRERSPEDPTDSPHSAKYTNYNRVLLVLVVVAAVPLLAYATHEMGLQTGAIEHEDMTPELAELLTTERVTVRVEIEEIREVLTGADKEC